MDTDPNIFTPSDEAFARYLSNESSADESLAIESWALSSEERKAYLARMSAIWTVPSSRLHQWSDTRLWALFDERRTDTKYMSKYTRSHKIPNTTYRFISTLAASLVFVAAIGGVWWMAKSHGPAQPEVKQYTTQPGQRANLTLADGSVVTLGVDSKLIVSSRFADGDRQVTLLGEGYFDVAHDPGAPFVVNSGDLTVRVLGTSFNVRRYTSDPVASVAVAQGAVAVSEGGEERSLAAGDIAKISRGNIEVKYDAEAVAELSGWRNGWLSLEDMRLDVAIPILERWYNLDIGLSDKSLAERHVSGSFRNESPDAVLHYLAEALNARFERKGQQITFYSR